MLEASTVLSELKTLDEATFKPDLYEKSRSVKMCNNSYRFAILLCVLLFFIFYTISKEIISSENMFSILKEIVFKNKKNNATYGE